MSNNKYEQNTLGKYDCPDAGCDRTGSNGFDNPQALGAHRRYAHQVGVDGPLKLELPKRTKKHPKQVKAKFRTTTARVAHSPVPPLPQSNGHGMSLALALWDMPAIQEANASDLRSVFDAIIARRELLGTSGTV